MGVVLRELPHAGQAVQHARLLVAVDGAQLEVPQGQVPVAADLRFVDHHVREAVHGLDPVALVLHLGEVHGFLVVVHVARADPHVVPQDLRSQDNVVAPLEMLLALPVLDDGAQHRPLGVPDDESGAHLLVDLKEVQLPAELAVIAALGLLDEGEVLLHLFGCREPRPVNALEHLVVLVAPPVGARHVEELEGLDLSRRGDVRAAAQVGEVSLGVEAHRPDIGGQVLDQLHLVGLALLFEKLDRLFAADLTAREGLVLCGDLGHPLLYLFQVLGREGGLAVEIVVEAVLDGGADRDLDVREQLLDRFGHDVGNAVAQHAHSFRRVDVHGLNGAVLRHRAREVDHPVIEFRGHGVAGGLRLPGGQDLPGGQPRIEGHPGVVREVNIDLAHLAIPDFPPSPSRAGPLRS